MTEYKQKWSESQSDLQQQLKAAKKVQKIRGGRGGGEQKLVCLDLVTLFTIVSRKHGSTS